VVVLVYLVVALEAEVLVVLEVQVLLEAGAALVVRVKQVLLLLAVAVAVQVVLVMARLAHRVPVSNLGLTSLIQFFLIVFSPEHLVSTPMAL
jgi:hypothetical protein